MACFCKKLKDEAYPTLTALEKSILLRTYHQARDLFEPAPPPTPLGREISHHVSQQAQSPSSSRRGSLYSASHLMQTILDKPIPLESASNQDHTGVIRLFISCLSSKLQGRLARYGLARYHETGTSIDAIVKEVQTSFDPQHSASIRPQVTKYLSHGRIWIQICKYLAGDGAAEDYLGFLAYVSKPTTWERARPENRHEALDALRREQQIDKLAREATPSLRDFLDVLTAKPFIDETPAFAHNTHPASTTDIWSNPRSNAVVLRGGGGPVSDDMEMLLSVACFLSPSHDILLAMLKNGATPRKRWSADGKLTARESQVYPSLAIFLGDEERVTAALEALCSRQSAIATTCNGQAIAYRIPSDVMPSLLADIRPESVVFWQRQALLLSYHAIQWKYIEPSNSISESAISHLRYRLSQGSHTIAYDLKQTFGLPPDTIEDLAVTLLEAVRLPGISWKQFAMNQAVLFYDENWSTYAKSRLNETARLVSRLTKQSPAFCAPTASPAELHDDRIHAVAGLTAIQQCLDHMQEERFSKAEEVLVQWGSRSPQPMEQVSMFRKYAVLGQVKRQQGQFLEARRSIEIAHDFVVAGKDSSLYFDEDIPDLACSYADTLRELHCFEKASNHLKQVLDRTELLRLRSRIQASLAEVLFAQGHELMKSRGMEPEVAHLLKEADEICCSVGKLGNPDLLRFNRLRLQLTRAKIAFVRNMYVDAERMFQETLQMIGQFKRTNGYATMSIVNSMTHTLRRRQLYDLDADVETHSYREGLLQKSLDQLDELAGMADPTGARFWIPGLHKWDEWLGPQA